MDEAPQDLDTEAIRDRVIELGLLNEEEAYAAFGGYSRDGDEQPETFASYLLRQNLITLSQLAKLAGSLPAKSTLPDAFSDPEVGNVYSGLVIEQLLGKGGMGSVYLARRQDDGEPFVVKVLAKDLAHRPELRDRFQREAEVLSRLPPHPNIVGIGEIHADERRPHIVMEYVEGLSLERILDEQWSLPPPEAARVVRDIALALAVCHDAGIIHRDLKPANVLLTPEGQVKVVDFGLAKDLFAEGLTRPGMRLGTPYYMAPEQWGDHEVDPRCDIFALGATLYHLLVGEPPFQGVEKNEVGRKIQAGEFVMPRRVVPSITEDLELVIVQMLSPERRFRYPSMTACAEDLDRVLSGGPPRVPCLFQIRQGGGRGQRFALLPGKRFVLGRDVECDLLVSDSSVSRRHAMFRRESTGFVLRDLGSSFGTYVNEMRVDRPVGLKSGDCVRVGRVMLEFLDPVGAAAQQEDQGEADDAERRRERLPDPAIDALVTLGDKRIVLHLLEHLQPEPVGREQSIAQVEALLGSETAAAVTEKLDAADRRQRSRAPMLLFALTGENLGKDAAAWLAWWERVRDELPAQYGPDRPPYLMRLRVVEGEAGVTDLAIADERTRFTLGRDASCALPLSNRTVSRRHATIFRMHRRLGIRDEGSRLGTLVNGQRQRIGFIDPGDRITLGGVRLVLELQDTGDAKLPTAGLGLHVIDPAVFDVLVDLEHPSTATALVGFLHELEHMEWVQWTAAALFPADDDAAAQFVTTVERLYRDRAERAEEVLGRLLGERQGRGNTQRLAERRADLGPQLLPQGWLASSRDEATTRAPAER